MPRSRISSSRITSGRLPFFDAFYDENEPDNGQDYEVKSISETQSRGGYMVKTDDFAVLLWKNNATTDSVIEAAELQLISDPGSALIFVVDDEETLGGYFVLDDDQERLYRRLKKMGRLLYIEVDFVRPSPSDQSPQDGNRKLPRRGAKGSKS